MLEDVKWIEILGEAENGEIAVAKAEVLNPDLIIMDISMPEKNGMEATEQIIEKQPNMKILALSMHDDERYIQKMLEKGAMGYILKSSGKQELIDAIQVLIQGKSYFSKEVSDVMMNKYMPARNSSSGKSHISMEPLTNRQLEILKLVADGLTNHEIADKLYISQRTVDSHRRNLLDKFEVKNTAELIKYAVQKGMVG